MIGAAGAGTGAVAGLALLSKDNNVRQSDASMSTVNTEQLFSVRLVDDNSYRNSNRSSYGSGQFLSNGSLNALLKKKNLVIFKNWIVTETLLEPQITSGEVYQHIPELPLVN